MKRALCLCIVMIMCIAAAAMPVLAATSAKKVEATANVAADGSYVMDMKVQIKLDQVVDKVDFPVPLDAREITLMGSRPSSHRARDCLQLEIPARYLGATIPIYYSAQSNLALSEREGFVEMDIPLLNGFQYPIEAMEFAITLPAELEPGTDPVKFLSDTHGQVIESHLEFMIHERTVSGTLLRPLNDGASLMMHLTVPIEMFPQAELEQWSISFDDIAMYVLTAVAFVYWLIFLRALPPRRFHSATAPEGLSAGELGTALIGQGGDLTMMVLSWAQMGYILIHLDKHGRVILHKRMEMGNERSAYERKCFKLLFGKQLQVNGTGAYYAKLFHKIADIPPENRGYYQRRSGSIRIFRLILSLIGGLGGVAIGLALGSQAWLEVVLAIILAPLGFGSSYLMQDFILGLHLRGHLRMILGLGLALVWLGLGALAGELVVGVWMVVCQLLGGLAYGYGGMRTDTGRLAMRQILGLRRYLLTVSKVDLQRISRSRPDYFFSMAPYATALGVEDRFARRFGSKRLPACPWLTTGMDGHLSASDWAKLLGKAVSALDAKAMMLPIDRLLGRQ